MPAGVTLLILPRYRTEYVVVTPSPELAEATASGVEAVAPYANPDDAYGDNTLPSPPDATMRRPNWAVPGLDAVFVPPIAAILFTPDFSVSPLTVTVYQEDAVVATLNV